MTASALQIRLFGRLQLQVDNRWMSGFDTGKVTELFVYLLMHRDRTHFRETLADTLWSDCALGQAKKYLRQTLWQLQTALTNTGQPPLSQLIVSDSEWIRVELDEMVRLDVAEFEVAERATRGIPGQQLTPEQAQALQTTVELYKGDLLEGCYQDWILFERERFQIYFLNMLEKLIDYCEVTQAYEAGLDYGTRILRLDHAHESTHRRLMRLYYLRGDRTSAIRQYQDCRAALNQELSVQPAQETEQLYQQMIADSLPVPAQPSIVNPALVQPSSGNSVPWETILLDIEHMQKSLADLQQHIRTHIDLDRRVV